MPLKKRNLLDLDDFGHNEISLILDTTVSMSEILNRQIPRVPTLRGLTIANLFYEPSTRTRVSFEIAARSLGADVVNVAASGSSVEKGESLVDTLRTVKALGADMLVIRHQEAGAPYLAASTIDCPVINAGDGWHAHPSQALLDLYTVRSRLGHLEGLKLVIVGDIMHSRVARSNIWGFSRMGAHVTLCGPPQLLPKQIAQFPGTDGLIHIEPNLDIAIENANVVMALRIQRERMDGFQLPNLREYAKLYSVTEERLKLAHPGALVMHPGPLNQGVEISSSIAYSDSSVIEEQVTNGVATRMASIYLLAAGSENASDNVE
jgi:aspartate carbamoyltransferase catalytic subunit